MHSITTYLNNPEIFTPEEVEKLGETVQKNPSFQGARILYVLGLYQLHDSRFGEELRKAALYIPERSTLFQLFEQKTMTPQTLPQPTKKQKECGDRTQSLIESFLEVQPASLPSHRVHQVDASVDYMAYLMQQPDVMSEVLPNMHDMDESHEENDDFDDDESLLPDNIAQQTPRTGNDPYFTETLAHIYIKQGKYNKAIEIIRRLSLNVPEKNRYFADQIRFLEKLILNERASDNEKQ